jgi:hypothetical protein
MSVNTNVTVPDDCTDIMCRETAAQTDILVRRRGRLSTQVARSHRARVASTAEVTHDRYFEHDLAALSKAAGCAIGRTARESASRRLNGTPSTAPRMRSLRRASHRSASSTTSFGAWFPIRD